jgi:hypothetical protein
MFDIFGKKRRQEIFDKAYAEFVSGNYNITINNLSQLITEGSKDYNVYNLRAQTYLAINQSNLAFKDSIQSTNFEPNIDRNKIGYDIRNMITNQLKTGEIKVDIYELSYYFNFDNVFQLFEEHCTNSLNSIKDSNQKYSTLNFAESTKVKLIFIAYNYLYFNLVQILQNSNTFDDLFLKEFKSVLAKAIKRNFDIVEKEVGEKLKHPFYWLPLEVHFKPYFERTVSYYSEEHLLPYDKWLFWLGQDELETLSNYVFKNGKEINRLALVAECEFLSTFLLDIKKSIISNPMKE